VRDFVIGGGKVHIGQAGEKPADLTVNSAGEAFPLLVTGRIDLGRAARDYGMAVDGDAALAEMLRSWLGPV
jgi:hypothetical protein